MKYYSENDYLNVLNANEQEKELPEFGCGFCWDKKRNKEKELFFLDKANNMRICLYCTNCGRKYSEEE